MYKRLCKRRTGKTHRPVNRINHRVNWEAILNPTSDEEIANNHNSDDRCLLFTGLVAPVYWVGGNDGTDRLLGGSCENSIKI